MVLASTSLIKNHVWTETSIRRPNSALALLSESCNKWVRIEKALGSTLCDIKEKKENGKRKDKKNISIKKGEKV